MSNPLSDRWQTRSREHINETAGSERSQVPNQTRTVKPTIELPPCSTLRAIAPKSEMNTNLDFLRAFAVLCVLANHILSTLFTNEPNLWFSWMGRMGVLLFFVHTSLVLMQSLGRRGIEPGWKSRFYIRRAFRIYPLAVVCLASVLILRVPAVPHGTFSPGNWGAVLANFLLVQNLITADHHSILAPTWSLPYEVQMYLLLPVIFLLLTGVSNRRRWLHLGGLILLSLLAARLNYIWPKSLPELMAFFPCFMGGILAWQLLKVVKPYLHAWMWPVTLVGLSAVYIVWAAPRNDMRLQWLLCLSLGILVPLFRQIESPWLTSPVERIAKYSYGIYLVHDPLLWLTFVKLPFGVIGSSCMFSVLIVAVPFALYHLIEHPMIRLGLAITRTTSKSAEAGIDVVFKPAMLNNIS